MRKFAYPFQTPFGSSWTNLFEGREVSLQIKSYFSDDLNKASSFKSILFVSRETVFSDDATFADINVGGSKQGLVAK